MRATALETVSAIAEMVKPTDQTVGIEAITIAAQSLEEIEATYGPQGEHPLHYHNADHSVDVCRRAVRLTNILYPYIKPEYRENIYDLAIIAGATHDSEQLLGPGLNERASAEDAAARVAALGNVAINTQLFKRRLTRGIMATVVDRKPSGELVQTNLQRNAPDPIKFIMAFADINGIAMEGDKRMVRDATHLCHEFITDPTTEQLYDFLISQAGFLRERLNDGRIKSDLGYYFPDQVEPVYKDMRKAFHKNIISAYGLAKMLGQTPELSASIAGVARVIDGSVAGDLIGSVIRRRLK